MVEYRGVVLHIAQGYFWGTIDYQRNPASDVSSHFIVSDGVKGQGQDGDIAQMVDTATTAWTQKAGNGHWLSIEAAGFTPHGLTAAQIESCAQLLARAHREHGVPLQLADTPAGRGLGYHSMGSHPGHLDDWGHSACPGPAVVAQRSAILTRAIAITQGATVTDEQIAQTWAFAVAARDGTKTPAIPGRPAADAWVVTELRGLAVQLAAIRVEQAASAAREAALAAALAALATGGGTDVTPVLAAIAATSTAILAAIQTLTSGVAAGARVTADSLAPLPPAGP
jgi:hypothetical protein